MEIYIMNIEKALTKIEKAATKKKSKDIIALMNKADETVLVKALGALGQIGDEDSCNQITHFLDHENDAVRVAACKASIAINTEYMKTRVRYQLSVEQNAQVKREIQDAFNKANN